MIDLGIRMIVDQPDWVGINFQDGAHAVWCRRCGFIGSMWNYMLHQSTVHDRTPPHRAH